MKKIAKRPFDFLLELTREYWATGKKSVLHYRLDKAEELVKSTVGTEMNEFALTSFMDAILHGIAPDATNDEIYCALRVLGWEVSDEVDIAD